jgi:microcystin degradation protein MlrC
MRIYIAGVQHESSSFSPIPTAYRSFFRELWSPDQPQSCHGFGYGEACVIATDLGMEVVAGPFFNAQPSLPCTSAAWGRVSGEILDGLRSAGEVDAVFLCLHGAQMTDRLDDAEGDLLRRTRELVGDGVVVAALLDLHANVTPEMLQEADLVVSCREYPHVDYGVRAGEMLPIIEAIHDGRVRPLTVAVRIAAPGVFPTPEEPFSSLVTRMTADQFRPGVLAVSLNHGFEGSDSPLMAGSVVVTLDGDRVLGDEIADRVAADFLSTLRSQSWSGLGVDEAIDEALSSSKGPVVIADRSDNPGAGAPGDSTYLLAALLDRGIDAVALGVLWDPVATDMCHDAGVGARLPLRIGGKSGRLSGQPIDVDAEVIAVRSDAMQALFGRGEPSHPLGRSAAIRVGGIEIVLNSLREQVYSPHCFTEHGIDPMSKRIVVVKSMQHFMGGFASIAAHVVRCDGPGVATLNLSDLPFRRVKRPLFGLDPIEMIEPEPMDLVAPMRFTVQQ